jgi:membrane glycosyltransferase
MELHRSARSREALTEAIAHPRLARRSMPARPWAGSPLTRPFRRLLGTAPALPPRSADDERPLTPRRVLLLVLVVFCACLGTQAMADVLPQHGATVAERGLLVLFGILFAWISAGFWTAVMGAVVLLFGRAGPLARRLAAQPVRPLDPTVRTAIVMPICNEHVPTVFGGLAATIDSLVATGESEHFDVYVLSDTSNPDIRAAEHAAYSQLAARMAAEAEGDPAALRVHYRWRQRRTKRKAGNVADFCRRWGGAYRYFIVLDADSVMTGECITTLVRMMEASPDTGILQTAPRAVGHETLHGRIQQFAARAYGPLFTAGMRFWQLGESHYWGHNAILRMAPFLAHCALAPLPGNGPLGGEVMSHDFVEAALMRRAGWKVWVADELDGSYEQVPPNLLAELQRDRRWCQGNLQNSRLMFEPRLHTVHRTAFLTGVLAYASSPLWLAFLLLSTVLFAQSVGSDPTYFLEPYQLFPVWPTANVGLMLTLFGLTGVLLLAPKAMAIVAIVGRRDADRFGGVARLFASAFIEFLHSLLLAPVRMLFHSQFVLAALSGWKLDWKSPPRDDAATPWREAIARHGVHTLFAVAWAVAIVVTSATFPWWLSPILGGLFLAIPISVLTSRVRIGRALRAHGLMLTPEEHTEPRVLREARHAAAEVVAAGSASLGAVVVDPAMHTRVLAALPVRTPAAGDKAGAEARVLDRALRGGPSALDAADRLRLLSSRSSLAFLHREVLAQRAHSDWTAGVRVQRPAWRETLPPEAAELVHADDERLETASS